MSQKHLDSLDIGDEILLEIRNVDENGDIQRGLNIGDQKCRRKRRHAEINKSWSWEKIDENGDNKILEIGSIDE